MFCVPHNAIVGKAYIIKLSVQTEYEQQSEGLKYLTFDANQNLIFGVYITLQQDTVCFVLKQTKNYTAVLVGETIVHFSFTSSIGENSITLIPLEQ